MTFQSSFLIRCRLNAVPGSEPTKSYSIQHVQTGSEFRCADLQQAIDWIGLQNSEFITRSLTQTEAPEDAQ
jgi:hypothetical protein